MKKLFKLMGSIVYSIFFLPLYVLILIFGLDMILYFYFVILELVPVWGKVLISLAFIAFFFRILAGVRNNISEAISNIIQLIIVILISVAGVILSIVAWGELDYFVYYIAFVIVLATVIIWTSVSVLIKAE